LAAIGRRNVQEQNAETKARIRAVAALFKEDPLRVAWLFDLLQAQSVSAEGILVSLADVPEQSGQQYYGMWLTLERQFFRFSVVISRDTGEFELEEWRDVTAETIVNEHVPGTGKSFGFLALEVLRELQD